MPDVVHPQLTLPPSGFARLVYALKPASWGKLLIPTLIGQCAGFAHVFSRPDGVADLNEGTWWARSVLGWVFTVCLLGYIVLLNDWADQRVDAIKRRMFPSNCSPKTIPDGILDAHTVLVGGLGFGLLGCSVVAGLAAWGAWTAAWCGLACFLCFALYSLPPARLNYRGGGEVLEGLGVGLLLPLMQWITVSGHSQLDSQSALRMAAWLLGFGILAFASGVTSGFADEGSDREGGKRTIATWIGSRRAARLAAWCLTLAGVAFLLFLVTVPDVSSSGAPATGLTAQWQPGKVSVFVALLVVFVGFRFVLRRARSVDMSRFGSISAFKRALHRVILWCGLGMAGGALAEAIFASVA